MRHLITSSKLFFRFPFKLCTLAFELCLLGFVLCTYPGCSNPVSPKSSTQDTTSQNFTWQKYYFGVGGYTLLNDVAIISDSSIWAVGSIYLNDSTGNPETAPHNAIHWDGNNWEVKKITVNFRGNQITTPIEGIFAFSSTNIWLMATDPIHGDGNNWTDYDIRNLIVNNGITISKGWGSNSNSMYFIGRAGNIIKYTNGVWQKISSGTDMNINDIWGAVNPQTGVEEILAVASYPDTSAQRKIFQISGQTATEISSSGINWDLVSIWFKPESQYYVAGSGIYQKNLLSNTSWINMPLTITKYYTNCIRGSDVNDVVAVGSFGEVIHYNGVRWKSFRDETGLANAEYLSVAIKGNEIVAVGYDGQKAVILVGKR